MRFDTEQPAYRDLRDILKECTDPVVAWVGAGLSSPAGMPSWVGLRSILVQQIKQKALQCPDDDEKYTLLHAASEAEFNESLWNSFSVLQERLGRLEFSAAIRSALRATDKAPVPPAYAKLWKTGVNGIVNLNIDRFAKRAFSEVFPGKSISEFTSLNVRNSPRVLKSPHRWLAQIHGEIDDTESWVFTAQQLRDLFMRPGYAEFVTACFTSRTSIFLGISAEDVAVGGHLHKLTTQGIDSGSHFWITARNDDRVREWAEQAGLRVIKYSDAENHRELDELLDDLIGYISPDKAADPIRPEMPMALNMLPSPDALCALSGTEIRQKLNAHAAALLQATTPESIAAFERFVEEYEEAIYRGWRVTAKPPNNEILGYRILEECKEGAFGTVFRAEDGCGKHYALKVLHERVRRNHEMLQCFRRGVRSMQILTKEGLDGVVRYYNASEIPTTVVMDFIEGIDLDEAVRKNVLSDWQSRLFVASDLVRIIRNSHRLPARVLHRDIRPSNVMLEGCWGPNPVWEDIRVVVLDFDLSWHTNSYDVSISHPGTANGYLSPEQVERPRGISTRHAAVDSFGMGMTLYFMATGIEPRFAEHRYADWKSSLEGCAANNPCRLWNSLPNRYFRLVHSCTMDIQDDRLDMAQIQNEISRLSDAINSPDNVESAELLAEEVAARATQFDYEWDSEKAVAKLRNLPVTATLTGDERTGQLKLEFNWTKSGSDHHQRIQKWLPNAKEQALSALRKGGFDAIADTHIAGVSGRAHILVREVRNRGIGDVVHHVESALRAFEF